MLLLNNIKMTSFVKPLPGRVLQLALLQRKGVKVLVGVGRSIKGVGRYLN